MQSKSTHQSASVKILILVFVTFTKACCVKRNPNAVENLLGFSLLLKPKDNIDTENI